MWTRTVAGAAGQDDRGLDIEVGTDGSVIVGGYVARSEEEIDAYLAAFDRGGDRQWVQTFDREVGQDEFVSGIAIDDAGSITVTGAVFSEASDWDTWVARYEPDGTLRWSVFHGGAAAGEDQGVGVTAAGDRIVVAGYESRADATTDMWIRAYDGAGAELWTAMVDGPAGGTDVATDIAFDPATDRIGVVGYVTDPAADTNLWAGTYALDGSPGWTFTADGGAAGPDRGAGIAATGDGGWVVVGTAVVPEQTINAWVLSLSADGTERWSFTHDGPAHLGDGATDVAVDPAGTIAVSGFEFVTDDKWNVWIPTLLPDGSPVWTHRHAGAAGGDDLAAGIAWGPDGDVFVSGSTTARGDQFDLWMRRLAF